MLKEIKNNTKSVLEYIPILCAFGMIIGCGSYPLIIGALILTLSYCFSLTYKPYIFSSSIVLAMLFAESEVHIFGIGGLYALLILSGLFLIIFSFINMKAKLTFKVPKVISKGFITGCSLCALILTIPLIFGNKTFSSLTLIQYFENGFFSEVNQYSIIVSLVTLSIYYYLSKLKNKWLPSGALSVVFASIVYFICNFKLPCIIMGLELYKPIPDADFGNTIKLFILSLIAAFTIIAQLNSFIKNTKTLNKIVLTTGISNITGSILGAVCGGISPLATKDSLSCKAKPIITNLISFIILLCFILSFKYIALYIPVSSVASILAIKCWEVIKNNFIYIKNTNISSKIIFAFSFLSCLYNIILGAIFAFIMTLSKRIIKYEKN